MSKEILDTAAQLAQSVPQDTLQELMDLMVGMQGSLKWIFVFVASVAVMLLVNIIIIFRGRKGGRGYRPGHDRRPGAQAGADGKPDRGGQGGSPRRNDGGGQRKPGDGNRGGGQRQGGGQQGGRPQQERGGRPNQSSIDPMEMSLRDINQRLKNAEREQDSARRNIRDGEGGSDGEGRGRDGRPQQRGGGRDNRDGRDNRGGGGNRDDRGPRRDSNRDNRDNRGGNRQERQERGDGGRPQQEHDRFRQNDQGTAAPENAGSDMGGSDDQLQHGRRFTAKRRTLPDDSGGQEAADQQQYQPNTDSAPAGNPESFGEQGNDIQFGR